MISTKSFSRDNVIKDSKKLPKGAYICRIISAKVDQNEYGQRLIIAFDIDEGEYAGFYQEKYDANNNEDKKWTGVIRLVLPKEDGSEDDAWRVRQFNTAMVALEDSNPGYTWDGDERLFKHKKIGVVFNTKQFMSNNGQVIEFTQPKRLTSIQSVKEGSYYVPKDELLSTQPETPETSWLSPSVDDSEIPFV